MFSTMKCFDGSNNIKVYNLTPNISAPTVSMQVLMQQHILSYITRAVLGQDYHILSPMGQ